MWEMLLSNFQQIRPPFESSQEDTLNWCVAAHAQAEKMKGKSEAEVERFRTEIAERMWHVGCKPDRIGKRGHILEDFLHRDWGRMAIYRLEERAEGLGLDERVKQYGRHVDGIFEQFYEGVVKGPDDLIHVTCTGYLSPSGAQKIVSKRNWGEQTTVTHAYHMGCYGSIPAIRMARGFLSSEERARVDIVHTEVCCLHTNPAMHGLDQLVSQSLFADGFIKYSAERVCEGDHYRVLAVREEIIPNSLKAMTWDVVEWGFQMSLAKEVAVLIARSLKGYLARLTKGISLDYRTLFAVHPGGPKILLHVQEILGLTDFQMQYSFGVLKDYGNMSSATLPHIWKRILEDEQIPAETVVVSLAFGPGLSICGSVMVKTCGN